jgi:hypothetical protein
MPLPRMLALVCALALGLSLVGCQRSQVTDGPALDHTPGDTAAEMAFWHDLADRPLTSNNEAFHGLILFIEGQDPNQSYQDRVIWLMERGYIPQGFPGKANDAVERGTVASIVCQILKIKGGLTMRVIGPHPRYALRELVSLRIMQPGSTQQGMSGIEFVGIMGRAEEYQEGRL